MKFEVEVYQCALCKKDPEVKQVSQGIPCTYHVQCPECRQTAYGNSEEEAILVWNDRNNPYYKRMRERRYK